MSGEGYWLPAREMDCRTPLAERRKLAIKGQAAWPEPLLNMTCGDCMFWDTEDIAASSVDKGMGRCRRVAQLQLGKWGVQIKATQQACSEFAELWEDVL